MGGETKSSNGGSGVGGFRARMDHYLYSGDKKHVLAGIVIISAVFAVPWYLMNQGNKTPIPSRLLGTSRQSKERKTFFSFLFFSLLFG